MVTNDSSSPPRGSRISWHRSAATGSSTAPVLPLRGRSSASASAMDLARPRNVRRFVSTSTRPLAPTIIRATHRGLSSGERRRRCATTTPSSVHSVSTKIFPKAGCAASAAGGDSASSAKKVSSSGRRRRDRLETVNLRTSTSSSALTVTLITDSIPSNTRRNSARSAENAAEASPRAPLTG